MDSQSTIKSFKINSPHHANPLQCKSSTQSISTFQDISFSSYLKPKDPTPNPSETDTEINIFDAHKYFSETNDPEDIEGQQTSHDPLVVPRFSSASSVDQHTKNFQTRSSCGTPKTSSEVSWNSQTGLLANPPGLNSPSNKRVVSAAKKWFFRRRCCCSGKKSVQVQEVNSISAQRKPVVLINNEKMNSSNKANYLHTKREYIMEDRQNKVSLLPQSISSLYQSAHCRISASGRPFIDGIGFTFPIPSSSSDKGIVGKPIIKPLEDPSMENLLAKGTSNPLEDPSVARDDDVGSDASSDLFEIDSFSNQTTSYRRRDSLDDVEEIECDARKFTSANGIKNDIQCSGKGLDGPAPGPPPASVAATERSHPSEVISGLEIGEVDFLRQRVEKADDDGGKRMLGNNRVVLMSCLQEKAVGVRPQPVAEGGPPMLSLNVGGRPPMGSANHAAATRLSLAFAA